MCRASSRASQSLSAFHAVHGRVEIAVGAVVCQRDTAGIKRANSFFCKKLSLAQRNYSTFERDCLAVVRAHEHFKVYLLARPFRLKSPRTPVALLKGAQGVGENHRMARDANGVPDANRVRARLRKCDR